MKWDYFIIDILSVAFEMLILSIFFKAISQKCNVNKRILFLGYLLSVVLHSAFYLITDNMVLRLLFVVVVNVLLSLMYEMSKKSRIFSCLLFAFFMAACELVVGFLMSGVLSLTVGNIIDNIIYYSVGVLCSKSLAFLLVNIFKLKYKSSDVEVSTSITITFSLFPLSTLIVGLVLISCFATDINSKYSILGVISIIVLTVVNILVFYLFERYAKQKNAKHNLEIDSIRLNAEKDYLKEIIEKQVLSAKEMHDLKNELFAIRQLLNQNVDKGINRIEDICNIVESLQGIVYTRNVSIDSLINSKMTLIKDNDIDFICECYISDFSNIEEIDLCILIGNLLDNAIEACMKCENNKIVKLCISQIGDMISINVSNTYNEINNNLETTKQNKYNHGFGIKSIKEVASKYNGVIDFNKNDIEFNASVLLSQVF